MTVFACFFYLLAFLLTYCGQVFERTMALEMVDVPDGLVFAGEVCADTDGFVRLGLA